MSRAGSSAAPVVVDGGRAEKTSEQHLDSSLIAVALHRRGVTSGIDARRAYDLPGLTALLTTWRTADVPESRKKEQPCWSPDLYGASDRRIRDNVISVSCAVLDYDNGTTIDDASALWADWYHIVHTSYRHTQEAPRFRLVLPLNRPVPVALWARAWHWLWERTKGQIDGSCKDPNRCYILPVHRSGAPHETRVHHVDDDRLLDLDAERLPPTPEELAEARAMEAARQRPKLRIVPAWAVQREQREALKTDPIVRGRAAEALGARLSNGNARGVKCPQCSRRSVWFPISPVKLHGAACSHRDTCGWTGWLDELLLGGGAS